MENLFQFIESHSSQLGNITVDWVATIFILIEITLFFAIKGFVHCYNLREVAKERGAWHQLVDYHVERSVFNIVAALISSYVIIAVVGNESNLLLNYIIAPLTAIMIALYINGIFKDHGWISAKYPEGLQNHKKGGSEVTPISVIVNNTNSENASNKIDDNDFSNFHDLGIITEEEIKEKGHTWFYNFLHHNQSQLNTRLEKAEDEMQNQSKILEILKEDRLSEKRLELEDLIYSALEQGFTTRRQDRVIREKFRVYQQLGGNGDMATLFNERYLGLKIHEERRKKQVPYEGPDRRKATQE